MIEPSNVKPVAASRSAEYQAGYANGRSHGEDIRHVSQAMWEDNRRKAEEYAGSSDYWRGYNQGIFDKDHK